VCVLLGQGDAAERCYRELQELKGLRSLEENLRTLNAQ